MSHITRIEISVKDLQALKQACKDLGLEFVDGQTHYRWFSRFMGDTELPQGMKESDLGKCDYVLRIPGNSEAYEVGIVKRGNEYILCYDFWSGGYGLEAAIGAGAQKLVQAYSKAVIKKENKELEEEGWTVQTKTLANGKVQMVYDDGND